MIFLQIKTTLLWNKFEHSNSNGDSLVFPMTIQNPDKETLKEYHQCISDKWRCNFRSEKCKSSKAGDSQYIPCDVSPTTTVGSLLSKCFGPSFNQHYDTKSYSVDVVIMPEIYSKTNPIVSHVFINEIHYTSPTNITHSKQFNRLLNDYIKTYNKFFNIKVNNISLNINPKSTHKNCNYNYNCNRDDKQDIDYKYNYNTMKIDISEQFAKIQKISCILEILCSQMGLDNITSNNVASTSPELHQKSSIAIIYKYYYLCTMGINMLNEWETFIINCDINKNDKNKILSYFDIWKLYFIALLQRCNLFYHRISFNVNSKWLSIIQKQIQLMINKKANAAAMMTNVWMQSFNGVNCNEHLMSSLQLFPHFLYSHAGSVIFSYDFCNLMMGSAENAGSNKINPKNDYRSLFVDWCLMSYLIQRIQANTRIIIYPRAFWNCVLIYFVINKYRKFRFTLATYKKISIICQRILEIDQIAILSKLTHPSKRTSMIELAKNIWRCNIGGYWSCQVEGLLLKLKKLFDKLVGNMNSNGINVAIDHDLMAAVEQKKKILSYFGRKIDCLNRLKQKYIKKYQNVVLDIATFKKFERDITVLSQLKEKWDSQYTVVGCYCIARELTSILNKNVKVPDERESLLLYHFGFNLEKPDNVGLKKIGEVEHNGEPLFSYLIFNRTKNQEYDGSLCHTCKRNDVKLYRPRICAKPKKFKKKSDKSDKSDKSGVPKTYFCSKKCYKKHWKWLNSLD